MLLPTDSDGDYLTFINLKSTANVVKKTLPPADDSISNDIDIPVGFAFGNTSQSTVYVSFTSCQSFISLMHDVPLNIHVGFNKWLSIFWPECNIFKESLPFQ